MRLASVKHGDDSVGVEPFLLDRGGEADEANQALRELVRLATLQTSEKEDEDGVGHELAKVGTAGWVGQKRLARVEGNK